MTFDAIVLAGGRASRMGGIDKTLLQIGGTTLLEMAIGSAAGARQLVVVGPDTLPVPPPARRVQEDPPFGGPAAAIAAGLNVLRHNGDPAPWTLVLAADQPAVTDLVAALFGAPGHPAAEISAGVDVLMAVDPAGRRQPLAALYATGPLLAAVDRAEKLTGMAVHRLIAQLSVLEIPHTAAGDVDTWADATRWGVQR
jgi:molybdopterin-guanine dinucleotide biosynthesis protein A